MATKTHPFTALHFMVKWGDSNNTVSFSEVSGLTLESEPIEYRGGDDISLTVRKIPGLRKYGNVTLKRGIVPVENGFWDWWNTIQSGTVERRPVTISLLNEEHKPVVTWEIQDAWPVKVEGPGLNATGNEIAIETLEFAHEGMKITSK
ncbi:MAG TPA: phage tail protein [Thermoleophilaceae bacterium]|nr:phage tail protein [Thermoleophilaceae bacterium]